MGKHGAEVGLQSLLKVILEQLCLAHKMAPADLGAGQWVHTLGSGEQGNERFWSDLVHDEDVALPQGPHTNNF